MVNHELIWAAEWQCIPKSECWVFIVSNVTSQQISNASTFSLFSVKLFFVLRAWRATAVVFYTQAFCVTLYVLSISLAISHTHTYIFDKVSGTARYTVPQRVFHTIPDSQHYRCPCYSYSLVSSCYFRKSHISNMLNVSFCIILCHEQQ